MGEGDATATLMGSDSWQFNVMDAPPTRAMILWSLVVLMASTHSSAPPHPRYLQPPVAFPFGPYNPRVATPDGALFICSDRVAPRPAPPCVPHHIIPRSITTQLSAASQDWNDIHGARCELRIRGNRLSSERVTELRAARSQGEENSLSHCQRKKDLRVPLLLHARNFG